MRFAFTDQQLEFRDAVRQVLAKECTTADVRAAFADPGAPSGRWASLADLGVTGLTVPDELGGLGLGLVDLVLLVEEAGRVALPEPLGVTAGVAAPLLAEIAAGDGPGAEQARTWAAGIAEGAVRAAVGTHTAAGLPVAGADGADLVVLSGTGADGPEIHGLAGPVAAVTAVASLDPTRRLGLPVEPTGPATCLLAGDGAAALLDRTADRAAVVTAAELLGLTEAMIAMAAAYAKERQQFGVAIGSFQAVKHLLAGAQVRLEFARPTVYAAAWMLDHDEAGADRAASVAKAYASEAALEAARASLQVHGAIGYTWECDLQLFLKRAWALAEARGSAADHRARLLGSLLTSR